MVLAHELAHVFSLQLSRSRVPRWFTEGLAELETARLRPDWRRQADVELAAALDGGQLPGLLDPVAGVRARPRIARTPRWPTCTPPRRWSSWSAASGFAQVAGGAGRLGRGDASDEQVLEQLAGMPAARGWTNASGPSCAQAPGAAARPAAPGYEQARKRAGLEAVRAGDQSRWRCSSCGQPWPRRPQQHRGQGAAGRAPGGDGRRGGAAGAGDRDPAPGAPER